jgi:hypothetical protein
MTPKDDTPGAAHVAALTPDFVPDATSVHVPKANKKQRRAALSWCLAEKWASADIDTLERIDDASRGLHGWAMWPRT